MPEHDLPGTVDDKPSAACAQDAPQSTTAPETGASMEATAGLDRRGYELSERLGGGGMGDVYRACDPALGRDLAVKVMKAELQGFTAAEQRFVREARVTGSLQHPGIVPIHNLGRLSDGRLHYTMRLVRGRTLADILREEAGKAEHLPALLMIFEKVCQAAAYAHSKEVIHRDLKPANVMVGRFGEAQVMDWGLAKLLTPGERGCVSAPSDEAIGTRIYTEAADTPLEQTRMGREMGTPAYMPPEQALGEWDLVDARADVFALGAMLCEILTGRPPYIGRDSSEVLRKSKRGDLAEGLARLESCGADAALLGLCRACLAPRPEDRPRDAEQVAQRVAAYQTEVQERLRRAEAERSAAVVKAREERKKRRWMLTAVLVLLVGGAASTWLAVRAKNAEKLARENEGMALTAAEAERQAKDLSQKRLGQIEKSNEVLTSIFRELDPRAEEKGGPSLRVQLSKHLERAAARLDDVAVGDPVTAARLQTALGQSLVLLGQTKLAIAILSKAGSTLEAKLGPEHKDTIASRYNLAMAYFFTGRYGDAIRLKEQIVKQRESMLGPDHPDTLSARLNLAEMYNFEGRTADAIRLLEPTLKQMEAKLEPDDQSTLNGRTILATAYQKAGRNAEAVRLHELALKQFEAKLGSDHYDTIRSRNNLAVAYFVAGRNADAVRLFEQSLKQYEALLGPDHHNTLVCRSNVARGYLSAGRTAEGIRLLEHNLKQEEAKLGHDHPATLNSRLSLVDAYQSTGQFAKAEPFYRAAKEQAQRQFGSDDSRTGDALSQLGLNLLKQKKYAEAEPMLRQCLTIREKKQPDVWNTFNARSMLGEALLGQKKNTEAEPMLVQGYEGMKQRQDKIPSAYRQPRLSEALERLVRLYEATGQNEKATEWRKKLDEAKPAQKNSKT